MFMMSKSFWWSFSGLLDVRFRSSANRDSFISFFPICFPFIFHSCLISLTRNSRTILLFNICYWREWTSFLIPNFRLNGFSFSPISMMLATCLSYDIHFAEIHSFYS
jgi:hypothetical protein